MKNRFKNILLTAIAGAFAAALPACGNFLEEYSQDEFEPKTTTAFAELLTGSGYTYVDNIFGVSEFLTDDVTGYYYQYFTYNDKTTAFRDVFAWQPNLYQRMEEIESKNAKTYQTLYSLIMVCNIVIEQAPGSTGSDTDKANLLGQALALRALYYLHLVNLYAMPYNAPGTTPSQTAGVPLVMASEILDEGLPRSSVETVYTQIATDIERAVAYLAEEKVDNGKFRIGYAAACTIASRVFLYMENWDKAITYADLAIRYAPSLTDLDGYTLDNTSGMMTTNCVISSLFPETMFVCGASRVDCSLRTGDMPVCLSDELVNAFSDTGDLRPNIYYQMNWMGKPITVKNGKAERSLAIRTSEAYLNRAEAYMEKYAAGDNEAASKAAADLNALRAKRIKNVATYSPASADDLRTMVRAERRRELCDEGHRWFDLRRYGMPELEHIWCDASNVRTKYVLQAGDAAYVLPIPPAALLRNTNLVQATLAPERTGEAL